MLVLLSACEQKPSETPIAQPTKPSKSTVTIQISPAMEKHFFGFSQQAQEMLTLALESAQQFESNLEAFSQVPTAELLNNLQSNWLQSHAFYLQALSALSTSPKSTKDLIPKLNQWPIEPGFIDALPQYPFSGIINDPFIEISTETLEKQHGLTHAYDATQGFQAIAFILWSEPGIEKFLPQKKTTTAPVDDHNPQLNLDPVQRRFKYLSSAIQLLQKNLEKLINIEQTFDHENINPQQLLHQITQQQLVFIQQCKNPQQPDHRDYNLYGIDKTQLTSDCLNYLKATWKPVVENSSENISEQASVENAAQKRPLLYVEELSSSLRLTTLPVNTLNSWQSWLKEIEQKTQQQTFTTMHVQPD